MKRLAWLFGALLLLSSILLAEKPPAADKVISEAKARAKTEQKTILLIFGASWCPSCADLETFLKQPAMQEIFDKHFVLIHLSVFEEAGEHPKENNPGGENLIDKFGGVHGDEVSLPFLVVLNNDGKPIVNSNRPKGKNVALPDTPEEIDWFMQMLRRGAPSMTEEEAGQVVDTLKQAAAS